MHSFPIWVSFICWPCELTTRESLSIYLAWRKFNICSLYHYKRRHNSFEQLSYQLCLDMTGALKPWALLAIFMFIVIVHADRCEHRDPDKCNPNTMLSCPIPHPKNDEKCPTYRCMRKTYRNPSDRNRKCKRYCPKFCEEGQRKCDGGRTKTVINSTFFVNPKNYLSATNFGVSFLFLWIYSCLVHYRVAGTSKFRYYTKSVS